MSRPFAKARRDARVLGALAVPVVITQVGSMAMGMVDMLMVGHVSIEALGAVSLGRVWAMGTLLVAMGLLLGIDPLITQGHGRRDPYATGLALQRGLLLAGLLSVPIAVGWLFTEPVLLFLRQDPELSREAAAYLRVQIPSIPFYLGFSALRQFLQGRSIVRPTMWVTLGANLANALLNWVFIFGHLGVPRMETVGAGIATGITRALLLLLLVAVVLGAKLHRGGWAGWSREALHLRGLREPIAFGIPIGIQIGLEIWAFEFATLFAGRLGALELAAHTVVLNLTSFAFMMPLGISMAAVTRVGNLIGEGRLRGAQRTSWVALFLGGAVMAGSALVFILFRRELPAFYGGDAALVALAATIMPIAAAFAVFDGTQVVGSGVLRGMGRPRPAAWFNFLAFYVLGLPVAWWLTFQRGWGLPGIWWGLSVGVGAVCVMYVGWIWKRGPERNANILKSSPRATTDAPAPREDP